MGQIYNKETNTFDFGKIVIHPNLTYDETIEKYINLINKYDNDNKRISVKQFKLNNYYYYISLKYNDNNIIEYIVLQIDDKKILIPKSWEEYNDADEEKKKDIEKQWLNIENIKNNDQIHAFIAFGYDALAKIIIHYKNNELSKKSGCTFILNIKKILSSIFH